ncbi:MAG: SDR family oxidoreductase [Oscillospiraceae bacterium]|jgi:NAD(P)-dependent dehydrogenase (short-subunit alcohol dehydrogenase family)|nr:SDR family oxidoreductase [Oscillospiraceae bacterium]
MGQLTGKTALITGGGSGIGAAIAKRFVAEGAKVVITGRRKDALAGTISAVPEGTALAFAGDVTKFEDAKAMVEATVNFGGGKIDILVNNAAIDPSGTIVEVPLEQWERVIYTNLFGPFYTMRAAIPYMIEANGGSIVNVASLAALRRIPAMPAYSSAKSGLIGLSQAAALDYGKYGIRVNVLCPGATRTDMLENSMKSLAEAQNTDVYGALKILTRFTPLGRPAEPDEVAGAAVFFASDDSLVITGAVLPIDAGACVVDPNGVSVSDSGTSWGNG